MSRDISDKELAIFDSTLHLVREHGFHGTPMSLVAKTAGLAVGTIYHYFDGKDDLICALYHYNRDRMVNVVDSAYERGDAPKHVFYNICRALYGFYDDNPDVLVFFEQFLNSPYRDAVDEKNYNNRPLHAFLSEAVEEGLFKDVPVRILISTMMCTIVSGAKLMLKEEGGMSGEEVEQTIGLLWDGFCRNGETETRNSKTNH